MLLVTSTSTSFYIVDLAPSDKTLTAGHNNDSNKHSSSPPSLSYRLDSTVVILCKEDRFGGMKIIETCRNQLPLVALVASGDTPGTSPRKLRIWNFESRSVLFETNFSTTIQGCCFTACGNFLGVAAEDSLGSLRIHVYRVAEDSHRAAQLHLLHSVAAAATGGFLLQCPRPSVSSSTSAPPSSCWPLLVYCSLGAPPPASTSSGRAGPGPGPVGAAGESGDGGSVSLWDSSGAGRLLNCIHAHRSAVQKMALNAEATLLATASTTATVVRVFAVPSGECLWSLRHRYCYESPFFLPTEAFHTLRFSSSSQLLLTASQERSGSHAGVVNLFWLGGPSLQEDGKEDGKEDEEEEEGRSSFAKDHGADAAAVSSATTTLRLEEEPDGFCCVTVSAPVSDSPGGGRDSESESESDCIQAATATQATPSSGYSEFFRSAAAMAAESLGRAAGLSVRAAAAAVLGLGCRPGDTSLPIFQATLPKSSGDGASPGQPIALAIAEQRPLASSGQVELLLAAGGGLLRSFKVPALAANSASSSGGGAALVDFLSDECRLLPESVRYDSSDTPHLPCSILSSYCYTATTSYFRIYFYFRASNPYYLVLSCRVCNISTYVFSCIRSQSLTFREHDSAFLRSLQINLSRLIIYAESADTSLQREVAEKLANEAVKSARQVQIVEYGGLKLLVPLTRSTDREVQRLAAHALANLSVNSDNQKLMAHENAIGSLIGLLDSDLDLIQRQAAKALANLGVNAANKAQIADEGGIPKLVRLATVAQIPVKIEAIAALANLAVNDANELEIVRLGGLEPIITSMALAAEGLEGSERVPRASRDLPLLEELATQCARALRNLSVNAANKSIIQKMNAARHLQVLMTYPNEKIAQQARRALRNLDGGSGK
eukprot:gene22256-30498_t